MRRRCAHGRERYVPEDGWKEWKGPEAVKAIAVEDINPEREVHGAIARIE
jgi:hypothetical protein